MKENPELFSRILAEPADDDARLVYADWLSTTTNGGDEKRGELISVECAIDRHERAFERASSRLHERDIELRKENERRWKAPLYEYMREGHFRRGFVETVTLPPYQDISELLHSLRDRTPVRWLSFDDGESRPNLAAAMAELGRCTALSRIEGVRLPERLDWFALGNAFRPDSQIIDLKWLIIPNHSIRGTDLMRLGSFEWKRLEVLDLSSDELDSSAVFAMMNSSGGRLAGLKHLGVSFADPSRDPFGADLLARNFAQATHMNRIERLTIPMGLTDDGMRALAEAKHFGALKTLRLEGPGMSEGWDALASASFLPSLLRFEIDCRVMGSAAALVGVEGVLRLLRSANFAKLRQLDLSHVPFGDEGGRALLESPHLGELRTLNLTACGLSAELKTKLSERFDAESRPS